MSKELLYKKLNALRLEVDSSIVDDIKKTVDDYVESLPCNISSYTYRELDEMIKERTKGMSIAERVNFKLGAEWWFEISNYKLSND